MDNLFLSETSGGASDDVDMHGSKPPGHWSSGLAGDYFDVGWNTFLKTDTTIAGGVVGNFIANVNQRGYSCRFTEIHNNVFLQSESNAITDHFDPPIEYGNSFNAGDPTLGRLLVGDFDGDSVDDVFLATGAAWYYSSGGQAEWRYLNRASEPASALLLGDFDGDGRTDVLTLHGANIDVSWAGISAWRTINTAAGPLAYMAVGDFDGDGRSDLLLANGTQWYFAPGGRNWQPWPGGYTDQISELRFGHFTDKTKTQILRVKNHHWEVTEWGMNSWADLGEAPVDSVSGLVPGVFNSQGFTDLARVIPITNGNSVVAYHWQYTSPGHSTSWFEIGEYSTEPILVGRFKGGSQTGLLSWSDKHFYYAPPGQSSFEPLSRQPMR